MEFVGAIMGVNPSPPEVSQIGKHKRKELSAGMPKKPRQKVGETSSIAATEFWKPKFSTCELGRQLTEANSVQDYDTSLALARAIMLSNDVATLSKETSKTMRSLLVM